MTWYQSLYHFALFYWWLSSISKNISKINLSGFNIYLFLGQRVSIGKILTGFAQQSPKIKFWRLVFFLTIFGPWWIRQVGRCLLTSNPLFFNKNKLKSFFIKKNLHFDASANNTIVIAIHWRIYQRGSSLQILKKKLYSILFYNN